MRIRNSEQNKYVLRTFFNFFIVNIVHKTINFGHLICFTFAIFHKFRNNSFGGKFELCVSSSRHVAQCDEDGPVLWSVVLTPAHAQPPQAARLHQGSHMAAYVSVTCLKDLLDSNSGPLPCTVLMQLCRNKTT